MTDLRTELQALHDAHRRLSPQLVVDAARPHDHPLHRYFQWDDAAAGESFRLLQARGLIRSLTVIYRENTETGEEFRRRAYVSTGENSRPSEYVATEEVLKDPLQYKLVLRMFERAILALKRQYGHLSEFEAMLRKHGLGDQDAA